MVCSGLEIMGTGIDGFLKYPLSCDYYFYLKIMIGLWVILGSLLYYEERRRVSKANILSSLAISGIAILFIAVVGSLIGIITSDILIILMILVLIPVVIWILT